MLQKIALSFCMLSVLLFISCSSTSSKANDTDKLSVQQSKQEPTAQREVVKVEKTPLVAKPAWEEYSEEDIACEAALDEAIITFSLALKKGRILSIQKEFPICVHMFKDDKGNAQIKLLHMVSTPGAKPVITAEVLQEYSLPASVTFAESERYFWYDRQGNIDFFEPDQILRTFDNPPQGDIIVVPKNPHIPRRAVIDVSKQKTELQYHQYIISQ